MRTVRSGGELRTALREVSTLAEKDFETILKKLAMDSIRSLITRTAIDTGYARSRWQVTVSKPEEGPHKGPRTPGRRKGARVYPEPQTTEMNGVKVGSIIVMYNNTEYIIHLETGTAEMRAQPMIEPTYQLLLKVAKSLSAELSKRKYNV